MGSTFSLPYAHINQSLTHQALPVSTPKPVSYFSFFVPFTNTSLVIKTPTTLPTLYQSFRYGRFWAKYIYIYLPPLIPSPTTLWEPYSYWLHFTDERN